jgi:hypothetical protein
MNHADFTLFAIFQDVLTLVWICVYVLALRITYTLGFGNLRFGK